MTQDIRKLISVVEKLFEDVTVSEGGGGRNGELETEAKLANFPVAGTGGY